MPSQIPDASTKGFAKASQYETHRPSYPADAVESLLQSVHVAGASGAQVIDLAAGTGKFTEILAARPERFEITAVEPQDDMRAELLKKALPGVKVVSGEAASMPVESGPVDAVLVAQAWHWFANEEALDEIYRVLVPGGSLGMIWNIEDYNAPKSWTPTTQWEKKLLDIVWATGNENPRLRHGQWRQVFERQLESNPLTINSANPRFSLPLGEATYKWTHWLSPEDVWSRFHTLSHMAILEGEELADTKKRVFEALSGPDVERDENGKVALHGQTISAWTTAVPGAPLKNGG